MRTIFWEVTARCNLRCKHCYLHDELTTPSAQDTDELGTKDCLKIVEQFDEANVFYVSVLGGEPFARPDILEILRYMGEKKFWTRITTNGTLIDEPTARELAAIHIQGLFVSLEGPRAEINDAVRGKGSFKKAIQGVDYLRDFGIPFCIQVTVNRLNYDKIDSIIDLCLHLGAERTIFNSFDCFQSNSQFSSLLKLGKEEIFSAAQKIAKTKEEYPEDFIVSDMTSALRFLPRRPDPAVKNDRFIRCDLGLTQLAVLSNGDVIACKYMRDIILCNLQTTHLSEIPKLPQFKKFKDMRTLTIDEANEKCSTCEWRYVCGGGCRGRAYLQHADLLAPDPHSCLLAKGEPYD